MTEAQLVIFDVGHGNASAYFAEQCCVIIDGGKDFTLAEYVEARAPDNIDAIIISHADEDHLKGILLLLEANPFLPVESIYVNPAQEKDSDLWHSFSIEVDRLEKLGTQIVTAITRSFPRRIEFGEMSVEVLSPPPAPVLVENRDNRWSVVLRMLFDGNPVATLCADMDRVALDQILAAKLSIRADILIFPHHGGSPGGADASRFTHDLVNAVGPSLIIYSMGRDYYGNPLRTVVDAARDAAPDAHLACTQLATKCSGRLYPKRHAEQYASGWVSGKSCAGTVVLDLPVERSRLVLDHHKTFVDELETANWGDEAAFFPQCRVHR